MLVRLVCVFVGRRRLVAVEVDSLDSLHEVKAQLHDFLKVSCSVGELRVYLAEKRRYRAWFRADEEEVDDLRSGREPPKDFKKVYLGRGNELDANERIQDFIPERFIRVSGEVHLFVVTPSGSAVRLSPPQLVQDNPLPRASAPKQSCTVVVNVRPRRCAATGCTKVRMLGGFCARHGGSKRCGYDSCKTAAKSGGLCFSHGGGTCCAMSQCSAKAAHKGGMCARHWKRSPAY